MAMAMTMHAIPLEVIAKLTNLETLQKGEKVDDLDLFPNRWDHPKVWDSPRIGWFNDFWDRPIGIQCAYLFTKQQIADMLVKARAHVVEELADEEEPMEQDLAEDLRKSYNELENNIKNYDESTHGFIGVIY